MIIYKGRVGENAYKVSKVWRLGFHAFSTEHSYIIRLCYMRTKSGTHYIQLSKDRECYGVCERRSDD